MSNKNKSFEELKFSVVVPGTKFELESNRSYRIMGRATSSSPREFKERSMTKVRNPLNTEAVYPLFDAKREVWDTGLYINSPCYAKVSTEEKKKTISTLETNLIPHLEQDLPEGALSHRESNKYFDSKPLMHVTEPLTVMTNTPQSFYGLFIAIAKGIIAPEKESGNPRYEETATAYKIMNKAEKVDNLQKLDLEKSKATANFLNLLISGKGKDKELLFDILDYVGCRVSKTTSDEILNAQFKNFLNNKKNSIKTAETFNETYKTFKSQKGSQQLHIYKVLKECADKNILTLDRGDYYIKDDNIGASLKEASKAVSSSKVLTAKLMDLYDSFK